MTNLKILCSLIPLALLTACATTSVTMLDTSEKYPPSKKIEILLTKPTKPFKVIALLETRGAVNTSLPQLLENMKWRAMWIGADAIYPYESTTVNVPQGFFYNPWLGGYQTIGGGQAPIIKGYAIKYMSSEPLKLYESAKASFEKKEYDKAIEDISKAIDYDPNNAHLYHFRGFVYAIKDETDKALVNLNRAIEIDPTPAENYVLRGMIYSQKKIYDSAIRDFKQAIAINVTIEPAYGGLGNAYLCIGQAEKAVETFRQGLELLLNDLEKDKSADKCLRASWYTLNLDRPEEAEQYAKEGLSSNPILNALRINLGHSYLIRGKKNESFAEYRNTLEQEPEITKRQFVTMLKIDFLMLKNRYPNMSPSIQWVESKLGL